MIHHYLIMRLEPLFEELYDERTFNCRKEKGVLYGLETLREDIRQCSADYTRDCWCARLDLQGFFMSIDKELLRERLRAFITERYHGEDKEDVLWLTETVVRHHPEWNCEMHCDTRLWEHLPPEKSLFTCGDGLGLPIGNLSSQHFANFLLSALDRYLSALGFEHHGRYVDDFYIISEDKRRILDAVPLIRTMLRDELHVTLHPKKFYIQHYSKGIEFTGAVVKYGRIMPGKRLKSQYLRSLRRLEHCTLRQLDGCIASVNSYLGLMVHMDSYSFRRATLTAIPERVWDMVYVKGHFQSIHRRLCFRRRHLEKEEYPEVLYAKDF